MKGNFIKFLQILRFPVKTEVQFIIPKVALPLIRLPMQYASSLNKV